jgi:hypothetical protein
MAPVRNTLNEQPRKTTNNSSGSSISVQEISLPKGGGAITGIGETFQPNAFSGTGSYSIPISITAARGFEPKLSIDYNSGSGNGAFGLGFSLSVPRISIRVSLGIPKYDGNDIFLFNGSELVRKDKPIYHDADGFEVSEYLLRVEGPFSLIKHHVKPDKSFSFWEITDPRSTTWKCLLKYLNGSSVIP